MTVAGILALLGKTQLQTARKIESKEELDEALRLAGLSFSAQIQPLRPDEKILWSGKPSRIRFLWQSFVVIPFLLARAPNMIASTLLRLPTRPSSSGHPFQRRS